MTIEPLTNSESVDCHYVCGRKAVAMVTAYVARPAIPMCDQHVADMRKLRGKA